MPPKPTAKRPRVYEVAERAGVSIATVSRALHGTAPVAEETRKRVQQAATELGWRPSRIAQAFAGRTHGIVGIVFPDLGGPYYAQVIAGFESGVVERSSAVLILATHGRDQAENLVVDLAERVDGLVIMGRTVSDELVADLDRVPIVLLARQAIGDIPAVRSDNLIAARELAEHLVGHGHRRFAFVGDPARSPDVGERWVGVHDVLTRHGLADDAALVTCGGFEPDHGYKAGVGLFTAAHDVDAIVCANDEIASGVYRAAVASGLEVGVDVAVTGWDDIAAAATLTPPLTTVRQPMRDLGAVAAAQLFTHMNGDTTEGAVLPTSVVVRSSCGCLGDEST